MCVAGVFDGGLVSEPQFGTAMQKIGYEMRVPDSVGALRGRPSTLWVPRSFSIGLTQALVSLLLSTLLPAEEKTTSASLADLNLEQLLNVSVTSVSKKEQKLNDAAAAVAVLSNDDLRRSGVTSIAEALRLVPGMDVASINASQWAVSARGFNSLYAKKLLVLVDGRAVYSPNFAGVYWDLQQTSLEDVDRIEVIRGPGATVWGANAVNGVINVVTRSAKDSQGGLIYAGGGNVHQTIGGARYGGRIGENTYYRVFGGYQLTDDSPLANRQSAADTWQGGQGGFRVDHYPDENAHLTWQGDASLVDLDSHDSSAYNINTLGRWTRTLSERSSIEAQVYYDRLNRNETLRARSTADTVDFTAQHTFGLGERNNVIWGFGYRYFSGKFGQSTPFIQIRQTDTHQQCFNTFVQDEFQVVPDKLILTLGTKLEHNDFTGLEVEPSIRSVFKITERQTLWSAVSRATRTPSEIEGHDVFGVFYGAPFAGPGGTYVPTIISNPNLDSERLWAYEIGYRIQPTKRLSLDFAAFYNKYSDLIAIGSISRFVPGIPFGSAEIPWGNVLEGETYGGEASATLAATETWRLTASYSLLLADLRGAASGTPEDEEASAPHHQGILRSSYDFSKAASLDSQLRYQDSIKGVPSYITADLRLSYRPTDRLELSLVGQNLLDDRHPEQSTAAFAVTAEVPRGFYFKLSWRF